MHETCATDTNQVNENKNYLHNFDLILDSINFGQCHRFVVAENSSWLWPILKITLIF